MANETIRLAEYAAALKYEDLPAAVVQRAKDCIADTTAAIVFGNGLPWSQMAISYAKRYGANGKSYVLGAGLPGLQAPSAAFANGVLSHAFELDSVTRPPAGLHPGGALLSATLALAQERGIGGRQLLTALIAGVEVAFRIGRATGHSNETRGFHGPATICPFGAAVACGHLLRFDAARMTNALGIAGSLSGGLMEFAKSGTGAMVKRLHLGRAAESGVLAASLAAEGFTGPSTVIEGKAGFLRVFCDSFDLDELTKGLGQDYGMLTLVTKRYASHIMTHTSVQATCELKAQHGITADQVDHVLVEGAERMVAGMSGKNPSDIMMAQYSVPFCVALALTHDPEDAASFSEASVADPQTRALCARVEVRQPDPPLPASSWGSTVTIFLKDGRTLGRTEREFAGMPSRPLTRGELYSKFRKLTESRFGKSTESTFERLQSIENEKDLGWFGSAA